LPEARDHRRHRAAQIDVRAAASSDSSLFDLEFRVESASDQRSDEESPDQAAFARIALDPLAAPIGGTEARIDWSSARVRAAQEGGDRSARPRAQSRPAAASHLRARALAAAVGLSCGVLAVVLALRGENGIRPSYLPDPTAASGPPRPALSQRARAQARAKRQTAQHRWTRPRVRRGARQLATSTSRRPLTPPRATRVRPPDRSEPPSASPRPSSEPSAARPPSLPAQRATTAQFSTEFAP
jgi:hypothetical protein